MKKTKYIYHALVLIMILLSKIYATDIHVSFSTQRGFGQYFFADLATMSPGLYQVVNNSTSSLCSVMVVHAFFLN